MWHCKIISQFATLPSLCLVVSLLVATGAYICMDRLGHLVTSRSPDPLETLWQEAR